MTLNRKLIATSISDIELMYGTADKIKLMRASGIRAVRTDFRFEDIQKNGIAHYQWMVEMLREGGIDILPIIGGNTKVATRLEAEQFTKHAVMLVKWLAGYGIHHIQYWNEPNLASRFIQPAHYARAVKMLYPALKAANPKVFCVGSGLATAHVSQTGHLTPNDWLQGCYDAGAKGYYDALAIHPYSYPRSLSQTAVRTGWTIMVNEFRPLVVANGEGAKKIWVTEAGYPTGGKEGLTEYGQRVNYAERLVIEMKKYSWMGPLFHYTLVDRNFDDGRESWFGIHRADGSPKPSVPAIRRAVLAFP